MESFEQADHMVDEQRVTELLTFVVIGAGPTGVEMAGAIAEVSAKTMLPDFPQLKRKNIRVVLIEAGDRILTSLHENLSTSAVEALQKWGVEVHLNSSVSEVTNEGVTVNGEFIRSTNVVWAAGNAASRLLTDLDTELGRAGRAVVTELGDAAHFAENGKPLPGVAQVAMQQGKFVGEWISASAKKATSRRTGFVYRDLGSMATIGRASAVVEVGNIRVTGLLAWLAWAFLHGAKLISFRNRLRVLIEWSWYYLTFQPGARLVMGYRKKRRSSP